jgi:DNA-binding response OmpR family regulator
MTETRVFQSHKQQRLLSEGIQVACIEQDYQALVMLQQFVTPDYRVKYLTFTEVQQGLEYCQRTPPDLILLDLDFPDLLALDSLLQLQLDVRTAHVPVIAFGNTSLASYVRDLSNSGLVTFMPRPLQKEVLMRALILALKDTSLVVESTF